MDDLDRLEALLAYQEATVRAAFARYLQLVHSPEVISHLTDLVEAGQVAEALDIVRSYIVQFGDSIPSVWQNVGTATATELQQAISGIAIAISFDPTHPRAAELIRENRMNLIVNLDDSQRESVRQALDRQLTAGGGPAESARAFRDAVGLAPVQEAAVANYRRMLERGDPDALERALRDRRFDGTVSRAIEQNKPLKPEQVDRMVTRYRARTLAMRSENIARTEALRATSQAREESLAQMMEQAGLSPDEVKRIWRATRDKRTRDWHASMNLQERAPGEKFEDGHGNLLLYPGDAEAPAETTINCRCTTTFRVDRKAA